jgi:hypothetical protein
MKQSRERAHFAHLSPRFLSQHISCLEAIEWQTHRAENIYRHECTNETAMPEAPKAKVSMAAYPNPTTGATHLDYSFSKDPEEIFVTLHNLEGKLVYQGSLKTKMPIGTVPIDVRHLSPGLYFVDLRSKSGEVVQTKLVKQ